MNDELGAGEGIRRFVMPQGRFTPIFGESARQRFWTFFYLTDFTIDIFLTKEWSSCFSTRVYLYFDETNSAFDSCNVGKCATGSGTHCC